MGRMAMSAKELKRVGVMERVGAGTLTLRSAAALLGLSYRQAKRIYRRYRAEGAPGLTHRSVGRASNRATAPERRAQALGLIRTKYSGTVEARFGPTLAAEHLAAEDGLAVHHETLRRWMLAAGLWSRSRKRSPHRRRRERKAHFGELVQLDGSLHPWFETRGPATCLLTLVDDATGHSAGWFSAQETIWAAVAGLRHWIETHGIPQALYTDWKNVYVRGLRRRNASRRPSRSRNSGGCARSWAFASFRPVRRRRKVASSATTARIRTGWSRSCGGRGSGTSTRRMRFSRRATGASTMRDSRGRPARRTIFTSQSPAGCDSMRCFGWTRRAPSRMTGSCAMRIGYFSSSDRVPHPPARSTVHVFEDRAGQIEIQYRHRRLRWTELTAPPKAVVPARAAAPPTGSGHGQAPTHPWRRQAVVDHYAYQQMVKDRRAWQRGQP